MKALKKLDLYFLNEILEKNQLQNIFKSRKNECIGLY
jgi:hypothetical protein